MSSTPSRKTLAIDGGTPAHKTPWRDGPFHHSTELRVLEKVLSGPKLPLARGKWVMAYRQHLQDLYGMKYAIPTSSGTTAIHVALYAAGVGAGDEVIVSPLTDYGSIIGIFQLNAIPVFADVVADSFLMDVQSIAACITPHTKAIMPVHNGGYAVDMPALMKLSRKHRIPIVEDCAQSHLSSIGGRYLGTFGDLGVWSTNESKHMKSGEGGFVLTNSKKLAEKAELFSDKCYPRFPGAPETPAFPALNVASERCQCGTGIRATQEAARLGEETAGLRSSLRGGDRWCARDPHYTEAERGSPQLLVGQFRRGRRCLRRRRWRVLPHVVGGGDSRRCPVAAVCAQLGGLPSTP
jgi:hypothetical protein